MKKALKYSLFLLCLNITCVTFAQIVNKREKLACYAVSRGTVLEVENKYGNIHLSNWDKDSVDIKMQMVVTAKNKDKLQKTLNDIHFDFRKSNGFITLKTTVDIGTFGQLTEELFKSNEDVEVNYYIKAPDYLSIKLENKFGNIYLEKVTGKADITLSHGDLKAKEIQGRLKLNFSFGDADINSLTTAYLDLSYAEVNIKEVSFVDIKSKSSDILIRKADKAVLDSRRGDIEFTEVGILSGKTTFADVEIGILKTELNLEMQYGDILIEKPSRNFSLINLNLKFSDVDLYFSNDVAFDFDMSHRKVDFSYSKNKAALETKSIDNSSKKDFFNTYGKFGGVITSKSRVRINAENGDIKITYQ